MHYLNVILGFTALITHVTSIPTSPSYARNASTGFGTIVTTTEGNVTRAVFHNPPIQLYDYRMINDLYDFLVDLQNTAIPPKVVIFSSADPEIFMLHIDIHSFLADQPIFNVTYSNQLLNRDVLTVRLLRHLPTIFIGEFDGLTSGAGNEFAVQLDMRFAGPNARFGALEVGGGVIHGNGGAQHLTRLIGPGRAAEYLMAVKDVDAPTADAYGWVNRAYSSGAELTSEVDKLAQRIAIFPAGALNGTKVSIRSNGPSEQQLQDDLDTLTRLYKGDEAQRIYHKFIEISGDETRTPFELGLDETMLELYEPPI